MQYKPRDVLRSRKGKTIEVLNGCGGRLVLADLVVNLRNEARSSWIWHFTGAALIAMGDGVNYHGTDQTSGTPAG